MASVNLHVHHYEVHRTSAITTGEVERLLLVGHDKLRDVPTQVWLYFEPIPGLYAVRNGIGVGTNIAPRGHTATGRRPRGRSKLDPRTARFWIYQDPAHFEAIRAGWSDGLFAGLTIRHEFFPGTSDSNRLVTGATLREQGGDDFGVEVLPADADCLVGASS